MGLKDLAEKGEPHRCLVCKALAEATPKNRLLLNEVLANRHVSAEELACELADDPDFPAIGETTIKKHRRAHMGD